MYTPSPKFLKKSEGLSFGSLGKYGTERLIKPLTRSGLNKHRHQPMIAPQSCPATKAFNSQNVNFSRNLSKYNSWILKKITFHLSSAVVVEQTDDISDEVAHSVRLVAWRRIGVSVTSEIWSDHVVTMARQEIDLVTPREPCLREAME